MKGLLKRDKALPLGYRLFFLLTESRNFNTTDQTKIAHRADVCLPKDISNKDV